MAGGASILLEPLSIPLYRWQGEFSPQARGPQAYAESKPVPLPSTIAGLLAGQFSAASGCTPGGDGEATVRRVLQDSLGSNFRLRGPYLYAEWRGDDGGRVRVVCFMLHNEMLYCVDADNPARGVKAEATAVQHVGAALDSLSKTVMERYMYTVRMADIYTTLARLAGEVGEGAARGGIEMFGVLVEVYGRTDGLKQLNDRIVWMGSRQRAYRLIVLEETPAGRIAGRTPRGEALLHIVSPILFCEDERLDYSVGAAMERGLYESLLEKMNVGLPGSRRQEVCERVVFTALGRGYDLCSNRKRPYCQAVMPGVQLRAELNDDPLRFYVEGVGSRRELGWGTVIPLPPPLWACGDVQD